MSTRHALSALALAALACTRVPADVQPEPAPEPAEAPTLPVRIAEAPPTVISLGRPPATPMTTADDPFTLLETLDSPGPNQYRAANGEPGPAYWQNEADYAIEATLDTATQTVSGLVRIRYTNRSPHRLSYVWLQLDQNLYRPGSLGSAINPPDSRWGARNFQGGYDLRDVTVNGRAVVPQVADTRMRLDLPAPIPAEGGTATIAMRFAFRVPEHGSDRLARDGGFYEMAQWFPRMAVFDDVTGWNTEPYLGQGEFYLDYGDYDVALTVPAGYTVAATGTLANPAQVLTAAQRRRLERAQRSTEVVQVITAGESAPRPTPGTRTWRFEADSVRDFAWAAGPALRWDAVSTGPIPGRPRGVLSQAYYTWPRAGRGWEDAAENTQWSIRTYSELVSPYPWPQATSVAGPVGGMEYPMFVMVRYSEEPNGAFGTIDHEHGHQWFPMIVGSNERRYAWMDEGLDTYINAFSREARFPEFLAWPTYMANWRDIQERGLSVPLMTPPDRIERPALGAIAYRKPALALLALRNHVIGPETMDRALRVYAERWAFKHPTPADFFRTVEDVSGEDLSWFWRGFFYTNDVLDIAIDSVTTREVAGQPSAVVHLRRTTSIPFPVEMRIAHADGTTRDVRLPVHVWRTGSTHEAVIPAGPGVRGVRLWPVPSVPDWSAANDVWGTPPAADSLGKVTLGGLNRLAPRR